VISRYPGMARMASRISSSLISIPGVGAGSGWSRASGISRGPLVEEMHPVRRQDGGLTWAGTADGLGWIIHYARYRVYV